MVLVSAQIQNLSQIRNQNLSQIRNQPPILLQHRLQILVHSRVSWDSSPPVFWFSQLAMASSASSVPMGTR